jgi:uncharacterized protein (TIGR02594 family)
MWFKIKLSSKLRIAATDPAPNGPMVFGDDIGKLIEERADLSMRNLQVRRKDGAVVNGWLAFDRLEPTDEPPRNEINLWAFLKTCVTAEIWVNDRPETAPHFVLADYLIALASIESGTKNPAPPKYNPNAAVGPFQISERDWQRFIEADTSKIFDADDRDDYLDQCYGAAYLAFADTKAVSELINAAALDGSNDDHVKDAAEPYVPSLSDVFLAHIVGPDAAADMRILAFSGQEMIKVETILLKHSVGPDRVIEKEVATLMRRRHDFLKVGANESQTIKGMFERIDRRLDSELKDAFDLMKEHIPEDIPSVVLDPPPVAAEAPAWIKLALDEKAVWEKAGVTEKTAAGKERILTYFAVTDTKPDASLAWCGAFVAHCLAQGGMKSTIMKASARASSWKKWANAEIPRGSDQVPQGAVVVLSPAPGSQRSGHVGFFSKFLKIDGVAHIELLGGNQSNTVQLSNFPRSKIASIRWSSDPPAVEKIDVDAAPPSKFDGLLELVSRFEGGTNYDAHYGARDNTNPRFTSMTIGQVRDWQRRFVKNGSKSSAVGRYQIIQNTMAGLIQSMKLSLDVLFDKGMQDRMAMQLLTSRGLGRFLKGSLSVEAFGRALAQEWASLPVLENCRGAHRRLRAGESYYAGDGLNKAHVDENDVRAVLERLLA